MNFPKVFRKTPYHFHALLAIAALACGGLAAAAVAVNGSDAPPNKLEIPSMAELKETSTAFTAVTQQASPAVVFIKVEKQRDVRDVATKFKGMPEGFDDDLLKRFFGDRAPQFKTPKFQFPDRPSPFVGQGSGFIITSDGYVVTNNHVVGGADHVKVTLADGREFDAEIVGTDERTDVAVIKIDADDLPVLAMGDSDSIKVGEWVLAVGSPFGLNGSVTSGIISATGRNRVGIADYEDFIQTDAAINPGNSGGPLLNLNGQAIGINTAIFSRTGVYNGIGFAIPINMARDICNQLIEKGSVTRGYLGVSIQELTPDLAKSFGLTDVQGILIGDVVKDSPADLAGFKSGDVIVRFRGQAVEEIGAFRNQVARLTPETKVEMTVLRDGKEIDVNVEIGELPSAKSEAKAETQEQSGMSESFGFKAQPLSDELASKFGHTGHAGVVVTEVQSGSAAAMAGIRSGALITEVNRQAVKNMDEFTAALEASEDKSSVLLRLKQGDHSHYVILKKRN